MTYDPVGQNVTNGPWSNINVDMTGKFGKANFFTSIGTMRQEGSIRFLDGYRRNSIRMNVDNTLGSNWTLSVRAYYARVEQDNYGGAFFSLTRQVAYADLLRTDSYGRLFVRSNAQVQGAQNFNPDYYMQANPARGQNDRFQGDVQARWQPLSWLDGDFSIGYDRTNLVQNNFYDAGMRSTNASGTNYLGGIGFGNSFNQSYNAAMNWTARKDITHDLNMRFTVRGLYEAQDNQANAGGGANLVVPGLFTLNALVPSASNTLRSSLSTDPADRHVRGRRPRVQVALHPERADPPRRVVAVRHRRTSGPTTAAGRSRGAPPKSRSGRSRTRSTISSSARPSARPATARASRSSTRRSTSPAERSRANTLGNVNLRPELSTEVEARLRRGDPAQVRPHR